MHAWFVSIVTVDIYSYTFRFDIHASCMATQCTSVSWQSHKAKAPQKAFHNPSKPFIKFSVCCAFSQCVSTCEKLLRTVLLVPVTLQCPVSVTGGAKTSTPGVLKLGGEKEEEKPDCCKIKAPQSFKALLFPESTSYEFQRPTSLPCKPPLTSTPNVPHFLPAQPSILRSCPPPPSPLLLLGLNRK